MTTIPQYQSFQQGPVLVAYIPRNAGALVQITLDGQRHGRHYDSHTEALDVYRQLAEAHRTPLEVDEQTVDTTGRTTITVQRPTPWAWTVTTYTGSRRIESWSAAYGHEHLAREAATRTARAFKEHGNAEMVECYRNELAIALQREMDRARRGMASTARLAYLRAQLDAVADLNIRNAALDALADSFAA